MPKITTPDGKEMEYEGLIVIAIKDDGMEVCITGAFSTRDFIVASRFIAQKGVELCET